MNTHKVLLVKSICNFQEQNRSVHSIETVCAQQAISFKMFMNCKIKWMPGQGRQFLLVLPASGYCVVRFKIIINYVDLIRCSRVSCFNAINVRFEKKKARHKKCRINASTSRISGYR